MSRFVVMETKSINSLSQKSALLDVVAGNLRDCSNDKINEANSTEDFF